MEHLDLSARARVAGTVDLPGSKSISNRTLLLAALCQGETLVKGLLASDDTQRMLEALATLGVRWEQVGDGRDFRIMGCGGDFPVKDASLFLGNAGTAFRPLTAALALADGSYHLHGVPRMHERPIGDLVDALRQAGARIEYLGNQGYPPLQIHPGTITGERVAVKGNVSSQFLTGLLMALPLAGRDITIEVVGELISKPYIEITLNLLKRFGITVERRGVNGNDWAEFFIPGGQTYHSPGEIFVEGDASSASYFLAAGAIAATADAPVVVTGVGRQSIQGDVRFAEALEAMGAVIERGDNWICASRPASGKLKAIDMDFNHIPDAAMTIAVAALFAEGTTTLRNIESWRVKETDRITAMATELRKVGATVEEGRDYLVVTPPAQLTPDAAIATYDDHRIAMCFSLVALAAPVRILDPGCTAKTFPTYFDELARITRR
ncbi:3-phosphoshikimate 1-carboxyvinyltransferase [Chitiniphilus purpureus]|uniref:3-phosphoshikimate 1-carboxyvinyltransferase n=1 Tax=Chitiniphilus purpureus TaxID=2981137 RepID=A0ABY6DS83_9NEIS|nr:3-phosphoshikimate 1-carboxyvinyltransferase [Chitiniphilus sp. CD1]UXY17229.1 3-phosphoshikimate 1-carboxyvinyltransferase [Chitiniphilus sp. CD1]